jgi:hypothetical protein
MAVKKTKILCYVINIRRFFWAYDSIVVPVEKPYSRWKHAFGWKQASRFIEEFLQNKKYEVKVRVENIVIDELMIIEDEYPVRLLSKKSSSLL